MEPLQFGHRMTWVVKYCSRFESDWMAMHRFLWMNAISGDGLWRAFTGKDWQVPVSRTVPVRFVQLIHDSPHAKEFSQHLRARSLVQCFGPGNACELEALSNIRFCPQCLAECFHSPIFQLANVENCPLHGTALRSSCLNCGRTLSALEFDPRNFDVPLACRHCGHCFVAEGVGDRALTGFAEGETVFRRIERCMRLLRGVQFQEVSELEGEPCQPRDHRTICDCLVRLAVRRVHRVPWSPGTAECNTVDRRADSELPSNQRFARDRIADPLNQDFETACTIARSINRQLSRIVRHACGHSRTVQLDWRYANRPFERMQPVLLMSPLDCPCCAVLDRWRAYAGKMFALRDVARGWQSGIYEESEVGYREMLHLKPSDFAKALLTSFTWFAVGMDQLLEYLGDGCAPLAHLATRLHLYRAW